MSHFDDGGMMHMPSPDRPNSGYATGSASGPAPDGMVFVPSLNTYVDHDVAAELGLGGRSGSGDLSRHTGMNPMGLRAGHDPYEDVHIDEMSDEELEIAQAALEQNQGLNSPSPTVDELEGALSPEVFHDGLEAMVETGDIEDTFERIANATGLDSQAATSLIEAAIMDVSPVALDAMGEPAWNSLVYAATATDDAMARRIVSDVVTGVLEPSRLSNAYALWFGKNGGKFMPRLPR